MSRFAVAVFFLSTLPLVAQQGRGNIYGTVTDPSGASVAAAKVTIVDTDTNNVTNTETNASGYFSSPPLIVGNYQVTVEHTGFKKETRTGLSLQVDQHAEVDIALQVGAVGESIDRGVGRECCLDLSLRIVRVAIVEVKRDRLAPSGRYGVMNTLDATFGGWRARTPVIDQDVLVAGSREAVPHRLSFVIGV